MSRFAAAAVDEPLTPVRYGPHGVVRGRLGAAMCTLFATVNLGIGAVRGPIGQPLKLLTYINAAGRLTCLVYRQ